MSDIDRSCFDSPLEQCPLCSSRAIAEYDRDYRGITVARCGDCRLLFMNPQYTDAYLAEYYAHYVPHHVPNDTPIATRRRISKNDDLKWIERFTKPGRLLSIGCGDGLELEVARARGWRVEGFDVDEDTTRRVALRAGLKIHCGDFFGCPWEREAYDCVFMDQVLEHPKNPQDYLRSVRNMLRPDGVLFIGCPNIASLSSLYKGMLGRMGLKRARRGRHYDTSHHLFYYSPRVLQTIVEQQYGYEVLAAEGDPLSGQKPFVPGSTLTDRLMIDLRKRFPLLDSTFRMLCRKRAVQEMPKTARAA